MRVRWYMICDYLTIVARAVHPPTINQSQGIGVTLCVLRGWRPTIKDRRYGPNHLV